MSSKWNVYKVKDRPVLSDPDVPGVRYHSVIFVETETGGTGWIHHVTGDLVTGMHYEKRRDPRPEDSATFHGKEFLGQILASSYPAVLDEICTSQPPPGRQKAFNPQTMRTEPTKPDGSFYAQDEPRQPLVKCTEWIEKQNYKPHLLLEEYGALPKLDTSLRMVLGGVEVDSQIETMDRYTELLCKGR